MSSSDYEREDKTEVNKKKFIDTNDYVLFGTPIELNEEELELGKKKMKISDQVATDEKGRRRFHGAFTGGFSAGYFNSCGSKDGWTPSTFVSSRSERSESNAQKPEYFMDEEDFSEYGIAPKKYSTKSKFQEKSGSIQNEINQQMESHSVLRSLISEENLYSSLNIVPKTTVGYELLRKMGWKEGRGFGETKEIEPVQTKVYGCDLPPSFKKAPKNVVIGPSTSDIKIPSSKKDLYGMGYKSLKPEADAFIETGQKNDVAFKPTEREKKGIRGTAFGIGVFDEYDEEDEIYQQDAIDNYDFSIETVNTEERQLENVTNHRLWFGFVKPKTNINLEEKQFNLPVIPDDYVPTPILGPDVSNTFEKGARRYFDSKARAKAVNDIQPILDSRDKIPEKVEIAKEKPSIHGDLKRKFVSSGEVVESKEDSVHKTAIKYANENMYGRKFTRTVNEWAPSELVCKRWNIVCLGSTKNNSQKSQTTKPQILLKPQNTNLNPVIKGPLSCLNTDNLEFKFDIAKKSKIYSAPSNYESVELKTDNIKCDKTVSTSPPINNPFNPISQPETLIEEQKKKPIDLFKAIFCDSEDD